MRTTLTLDEDVVAKLKLFARKKNLSFKEVVNQALRTGLDQALRQPKTKAYQIKSKPLGLRNGLSYDNLSELLIFGEGEAYK